MPKTDIIDNGFKSKDNPNMRWCKKDNIPADYKPVSKKIVGGKMGVGNDDTPKEDVFTSGDLVLCIKAAEKVKKEVKKDAPKKGGK